MGPAPPVQLSVDQDHLSFAFPSGAAKAAAALKVSNVGGGSFMFTASASVNNGAGWLSVAPASASASPGHPSVVTVTADPTGLQPGTYTGKIQIQAGSAGSSSIPVTMTISSLAHALRLTQTGLSFITVVQGGLVPAQTFGIVNSGSGSLAWNASVSTLQGGPNWLVASPSSGASTAGSPAPQISVSVSPAGLTPGLYYGLVKITAPGAANTPQVVTVFLEVEAAGSDPGTIVQPAELLLPLLPSGPPSSSELFLYNPSGAAKAYTVDEGGTAVAPSQGVLDPVNPTPPRHPILTPYCGSLHIDHSVFRRKSSAHKIDRIASRGGRQPFARKGGGRVRTHYVDSRRHQSFSSHHFARKLACGHRHDHSGRLRCAA